jgi:hypothetical protein
MRRARPALALRLLAASLLAAAATNAFAQVTFPLTFEASADTLDETERAYITSHVQAAGASWVAVLDVAGARSIEVAIALGDAPTANGGSVTSVFAGVVGGRNLFEQSAAAELRTGVDPNGATPDMRITFGTAYLRNELWFDPNPAQRIFPVPGDKTDAQSVVLHEFGHALAYNGWANGQGVPPDSYWSSFDQWMIAGAPTLFGGANAMLQFGTAPELTTNNIHHWANGPIPPLKRRDVERPVEWKDGVPLPWPGCDGVPSTDAPPSRDAPGARGNLPAGLLYELMNGVVFYRGTRYEISALDVATLEDVGLPVRELSLFASGFEGN